MEQRSKCIVHDENILRGEPRIAGTRLSVLFIKERVEEAEKRLEEVKVL